MLTPTQKVTARAQAFLPDDDITVAVRVDLEASGLTEKMKSYGVWSAMNAPVALVVALGGSILRTFRSKHAVDVSTAQAILAFRADGGTVLLACGGLSRKKPTSELDRADSTVAVVPNVELWETSFVPELEIGGRTMIVNRVDFRQLVKAAATDTIDAPLIKQNARALEPASARITFAN